MTSAGISRSRQRPHRSTLRLAECYTDRQPAQSGLDDASRVAPIDKLSLVLVAVFGVIFLGERLSIANWVGVALIAAGALLVAYRG
jgi:EamA-like transporter family protein